MADRLVVAAIQQKMHLPQTLDEYHEDLRRFMRVAVNKQARLIVFPELGGLMAAPPILGDFRSNLLKVADRGRRKRAGLWTRLVGGVANSLAMMLQADFRTGVRALLDVAAQDLWQSYAKVFSGLAREFGVTVVAPSAYLPDPSDGVVRNLACVFDHNGELVGHQAKVVLHAEDAGLAQPGSTWDVVPTEVGRIGLILGSDVLYPEVGRVLAYQGAEVLVCQGACTDVTYYNKLRAAALARMQDNQLFAVASFLVGDNRFSRVPRMPFVGKSAIFAPQELTPRHNGVLVEMGNARSEGVLAAPWDFVALRELWENSDTPVRQQLPLQQAGKILAQLYSRMQALPSQTDPDVLTVSQRSPTPAPLDDASMSFQTLDDLIVLGSVKSTWPPAIDFEAQSQVEASSAGTSADDDDGQPAAATEINGGLDDPQISYDDETDEMDAVSDRDPGRER